MRVTLREIAKRCGVSTATVSYVFNNKAHLVSLQRQKMIRRVAEELGYRPNAAARAMVKNRFNCVAILGDSQRERGSTLFSDLLDGIADALAWRNMHLIYTKIPEDILAHPDRAPKVLKELVVDGIILNFQVFTLPEIEKNLIAMMMPTIWINAKRDTDCVRPDDFGGGRQATEVFIRQGHRRIVYFDIWLARSDMHYSRAERREGYLAAMSEAGLQPILLTTEEMAKQTDDALPLNAALFRGRDAVSAIITYGSSDVAYLYNFCRSLSLALGTDIALATFVVAPERIIIPATTFRVPMYEIGQEAVAMIAQKIAAPHDTLPPRIIPLRPENER